MYKARKTETECWERGEWGQCYISGNVAKYSGESRKTFRGISPNILVNVAKHFMEYPQTFSGMSSNILGNGTKYSWEWLQKFRGMLQKVRWMKHWKALIYSEIVQLE